MSFWQNLHHWLLRKLSEWVNMTFPFQCVSMWLYDCNFIEIQISTICPAFTSHIFTIRPSVSCLLPILYRWVKITIISKKGSWGRFICCLENSLYTYNNTVILPRHNLKILQVLFQDWFHWFKLTEFWYFVYKFTRQCPIHVKSALV